MSKEEFAALLRPVPLKAESGWQAFLLRPPATAEEKQEWLLHLDAWLHDVCRERRLAREMFLQVWKMGSKGGGPLYAQNIQNWLPAKAVGIWPGRPAPQRFTQAIAMECAAAMLAGEEQPLPVHAVVHISAGAEAAQHAWTTMFGTEMTVQLLFPADHARTWAARSREVFLSQISDTLYLRERFYLPLLDAAIVQGASMEDLDIWSCGAEAYLRESPEDKGLLLLTRFLPEGM